MLSLPLATFLGVWGITTLSRLPPGALTLAAVRTADERGIRAATAFLAGAFLAELAVTAVLIGGVASLPPELVQHGGARPAALSLALAAAGVVLLWPASGARDGRSAAQRGVTVAAGFGVALSTPGLWTWWGTVGLVLLAEVGPSADALALGVAVAVGLATSNAVVLIALRAMTVTMPQPSRRFRQCLGVALLVAAAIVMALGLGVGSGHQGDVDAPVGGAASGSLVGRYWLFGRPSLDL